MIIILVIINFGVIIICLTHFSKWINWHTDVDKYYLWSYFIIILTSRSCNYIFRFLNEFFHQNKWKKKTESEAWSYRIWCYIFLISAFAEKHQTLVKQDLLTEKRCTIWVLCFVASPDQDKERKWEISKLG